MTNPVMYRFAQGRFHTKKESALREHLAVAKLCRNCMDGIHTEKHTAIGCTKYAVGEEPDGYICTCKEKP